MGSIYWMGAGLSEMLIYLYLWTKIYQKHSDQLKHVVDLLIHLIS